MANAMKYLDVQSVIEINQSFSADGIRDRPSLVSAVYQPMQGAFGVEFYPTLPEKAAVLMRGLACNHCFVTANKRTALAAMVGMLAVNGKGLQVTEPEYVPFTVSVATSAIDVPEITEWISGRMCPLVRLRHPSVTEMERALYRLGQQ